MKTKLKILGCFLAMELWFFSFSPPLPAAGAAWKSVTDAGSEEREVCGQVLEGFARYQLWLRLLNADEISWPVSSYVNAMAYLRPYYADELLRRVVCHTAVRDWRTGKLTTVPRESIPLWDSEDVPWLSFTRPDEKTFIFQRHYYNCYVTDPDYDYLVTARYADGRWKISGLELRAASSSGRETE
ncbi:MAG: hypothetical protein LBR98_04395 [Syntrophomonadaceae bacterium]|jgi:hypothetical protein|nr:hypothetical protein [Syntrophomonadaceae bacterium]